jgi:hypothetical protein
MLMSKAAYVKLMRAARDAVEHPPGADTFVVMTELGQTVVHDERVARKMAQDLIDILGVEDSLVVQLCQLTTRAERPSPQPQCDDEEIPDAALEGDEL